MNRLQFLNLIFVGVLSCCALPACAGENGTREEAVAMVARVQKLLKDNGPEKANASVTAKELNDRDLYPFVYTLDGVVVAHGANVALVGKNLIGLKDQNGMAMISAMVTIAKSDKPGWVDYSWPNPLTKKIEEKSAYIERAGDYFVGVGVYR